ncbi:hypothetical protein H0H93_016887 [Arthromyces matolae]|nr:hypothetical protein H0H93_016887 [Arthromyces matolae]
MDNIAFYPASTGRNTGNADTVRTEDAVSKFFASHSNIISSWPEMQALPTPEEKFSDRLLALQNHLRSLFPNTLKGYMRVYSLEVDLMSFTTKGYRYRNSGFPDLSVSLQKAGNLLDHFLLHRFSIVKCTPNILKEVVQQSENSLKEDSVRLRLKHKGDTTFAAANRIGQFKNTEWISDDIINYFVDKWANLVHDSNKLTTSWNAQIHLMGDDHLPLNNVSEKTMRIIDKGKFLFNIKDNPEKHAVEKWSRLVMPVFKRRAKHWIVLIADFKEKKMAVFDSMNDMNEEFNRKLTQILQKVLDVLFDHYNQPKIVLEHIIPIGNLDDCGIHSLAWMEYFMRGYALQKDHRKAFPFQHLNQAATVQGYRLYFLIQLLQFLEMLPTTT